MTDDRGMKRPSRSVGRRDLSASMESWRVFYAIELPPAVYSQASSHISKLRKQFPNISATWSAEGKFHLTLKFIGEIQRARVESLSLAADRATNHLSPFNLIVAGTGAFPERGIPKVLWLGIEDPSGKLAELQARLEVECAREGFPKEERSFHPHLTLARLRKPHGVRALATAHKDAGFAAIEFSISELPVIRSELSSAGPKYTVISRHVLGAPVGSL